MSIDKDTLKFKSMIVDEFSPEYIANLLIEYAVIEETRLFMLDFAIENGRSPDDDEYDMTYIKSLSLVKINNLINSDVGGPIFNTNE